MAFFRRTPKGLGLILLAAWLIATGVLVLVPQLHFPRDPEVLAVLAIASGAVILWERY
jgi:hypothetical protein